MTGEGAAPPINSEVRKIAQDTLDSLKYGWSAAVARPDLAVRDGSVEALFRKAFAGFSPERQARVSARGKALIEQAPAAREAIFGRYGKLDAPELLSRGAFRADEAPGVGPVALDAGRLGLSRPRIEIPANARFEGGNLIIPNVVLPEGRDFESVVESRREAALNSGLAPVERIAELYGVERYGAPDGGPEGFEPQAVLDKLRLEIHQVKCIDETNPEWPGSDEIAIGGTSVDEDGDTKKINEIYVGGGFDDGDTKTYSNYMNFHWFSVTEGNYWPKRYTVTMLLAEKDNGGFGNILDTLYSLVRDKVKSAIQQAVAGILTAYLGPILAEAIGMAVAWVVDALIGWIISAFQDDVFPPYTATMTHAGLGARWSINGQWGYTYSNWAYAYFTGHGGQYRVRYRWRLYA